MTYNEIEKAVNDCKCPEPSFCTVATTCYEPDERKEICIRCWLKHSLSVDAIEKQIPKKPILATYYDDKTDRDVAYDECPNCFEDLSVGDLREKYGINNCPYCGQTILWG